MLKSMPRKARTVFVCGGRPEFGKGKFELVSCVSEIDGVRVDRAGGMGICDVGRWEDTYRMQRRLKHVLGCLVRHRFHIHY
jgi:hypothetical protein